ncbi:MAG: Ig-like domain-containing protein [Pseudomonadota bacterium]|nr:Ig-like domain-containing protein [Pseudomonadota bacterium]
MAKNSNKVNVKLSNATDNEKSINSKSNHKLQHGDDQQVSGAEMGISGVSNKAQVSADIGEGYANISLDSAWNSVKNIQLSSRSAADVKIDNFVHTNINLRGDGDSNVEVTGAKRGNIYTGNGDDNISVDAQTNGSGWSNNFLIRSGFGDDTITLDGDKGHTIFKVIAGFGDDVVKMIGDDYKSSNVNLGSGNDSFEGGSGSDRVLSRSGDNRIETGAGEDSIYVGRGNDIVDGGVGADRISAGDGDDIVKYDADDQRIDGGRGNDTLVVDGDIDVDLGQVRRFENIDLKDGAGDDSVTISMSEARTLSDTDIVKITGDMGDFVADFDFMKQNDDVTEGDVTFAVFEGFRGEQIWVEHGISVGDRVMGEPEPEQFEMVFVSEEAGYKNTIGYYVVDQNGEISDVQLNFDNASAYRSGGDLIDGYSSSAIDAPDGSHVEFFIISNGFNKNGGFKKLDLEAGELKFVNAEGGNASVLDADAPKLVLVGEDGQEVALKGDIFHTNYANLSADGLSHAEIEASEDGSSVQISFEDVKGLGDQDFDDLVVEVNFGPFNGLVAGVEAGTGPVNAPVAQDDGIEQSVVLGSIGEHGSMADWGTLNEDGSVSFDKEGVSGSIQALNVNGSASGVEYSVGREGGGRDDYGLGVSGGQSNEVDLNESLVVNFDSPVQGARVGLDSLYSHFNEGSRQDARVSYKAYKDGELVAEGEVINDLHNVDGDGKRETNFFDVDVSFDSLVVETVSPTSTTNSNFVLQYIEVNTGTGFPVEEGEPLVIDAATLLENDFDLDGDVLNIVSTSATSENGGSIQFNPETGEVTYTSADGFVGEDSFTYTISDGQGGESTATVNVLVKEGDASAEPVNTAPVAEDDLFVTDEDTETSFTVEQLLANDVDADGDALTLQTFDATTANGGVIALDETTGEMTYTPAENFAGLDSFTYTVSDGQGGESTAMAYITVSPVDDASDIQGESYQVAEDTTLALTVNDLLANDSDIDGDALTITAVSTSSDQGGVVDFDPTTGEISYTPEADFNGDDSFTYTVTSSSGAEYTATVAVNVTPVYDAPEAQAITATAVEDGSPVVLDANVLNVDGQALFYSLASTTDEGTVTNNNDGTFTFDVGGAFQDLDSGEVREVRFTYQVTDLSGNSSVADAVITVAGINDAPTATNMAYSFNEDAVTAINAAYNVSDVDDEPLTVTLLGQLDAATEGTVVDNGDGTFSFQPATDSNAYNYLAEGESLVLSVEYAVTDGDATSTATLQFTINGQDDAMVVAPVVIGEDEVVTDDGQPIVIDLGGAVSDADGSVTITIPNPPAPEEGEIVDNGDGTYTFVPAPELDALDEGESQTITFEYEATDEQGNTVVEVVTIVVTGTNDAPVASNIMVTTEEDNSVAAPLSATDADANDTLTYSIVNAPDPVTEGIVVLNGDHFSFYPAESLNAMAVGETREITFNYRAYDGDAYSNEASVTIEVIGTNDAPVVNDITLNATEEGAPVQINIRSFIDDVDSDDTSESLTYAINQPNQGQLVDLGDGLIEFRPNGDFNNLAAGDLMVMNVPLVVRDSHGASTTLNLTVSVAGENDAPVASDLSVSTTEDSNGTSFAIPASDVDGDGLTVTFLDVPPELNVTVNRLNANVTLSDALQVLDNGESVVYNVNYIVSDGVESVQHVATFTVTGSNDAPVIESIATTMLENDVSVTHALSSVDVEGDDVVYLIQNPPLDSDGYVTIDNVNDTFTFHAGPGLEGMQAGEFRIVEFTYVATDGKDTSAPQTVQVTIEGQNDAPVISAVSIVMGEDDGTQTFALAVSDVDNDLASLTYTLLEAPTNGTIVLNGDGTFSVTPGEELQSLNDGEAASIDFRFSVSDGDNIVERDATVVVVGSTDLPVANDVIFGEPIQSVETYLFEFDINEAFSNLIGDETITVTDLNGNPVSFVSYDAQTQMVKGVPGSTDFGEYDLRVNVQSANGQSVSQEFKLYVNEIGASLDTSAIITGSSNDVITGTSMSEYISTDGGVDVVNAGAGNDVILAGKGNDVLDGGAGNDTFLYAGRFILDGADTIIGGEGFDQIVVSSSGSGLFYLDGDFSYDVNSIEALKSSNGSPLRIYNSSGFDTMDFSQTHVIDGTKFYGGYGDDVITGSSSADYIYGQNDNDVIDGYLGDDVLFGDNGDDVVSGGAGNDFINGGSGSDSLYGGEGNDTLLLDILDAVVDGGEGGFDILSHRQDSNIDIAGSAMNIRNIEAIDMDVGNFGNELTLGLSDVLEMRDPQSDVLYILGDNGDNVNTGGTFDVTSRVDVVDTNGDGVTDTTFQVYRSTLQSDVFIGLELGVGLSLDGNTV